MQVQHEVELIESNQQTSDTNPRELLATAANQSTTITALDSYTLVAQAVLSPIEHLVCCPQSNLVAVHSNSTNQILLIDTKTYLTRERFPLKACDKKFSKQSFTLKGMDFSPDGTRLAIGQTDCIIYIYRLANLQPSVVPTSTGTLETITTTPMTTTTAAAATAVAATQGKPTITGKFVCSSPITCLLWTDCGILFGTQDGKVKLISMPAKPSSSSSSESNQAGATPVVASSSSTQSTKVISIYNSPKGSMPLSLAFKFPIVAIGFVDCKVQLIGLPSDVSIPMDSSSNSQLIATNSSLFPTALGNDSTAAIGASSRRSSTAPVAAYYQQTPSSSIEHSCPPNLLTMLANVVCCAGSDGRIALHSFQLDAKGGGPTSIALAVVWLQNVDLKEEILAIDYSPTNEILAVATATRLLFVKHDQESGSWQLQNSFIELTNAISLTSVRWTKEGAQILVGTLGGALELFKCSWNKQSIGEQLDICHIAKNRVRITDRARNLLATFKTQHDIKRVNLLDNGQSVIIWTSQSLLLARLGQPSLAASSELPWSPRERGNSKFCFDHPGFVLIYNGLTRELLLVRLGQDSIVYRTKLERLRKKLISVRRYPPPAYSLVAAANSSGSRRASEYSPEKTSPSARQRSAGSARSRLSSAAANREPPPVAPVEQLADLSPTSSPEAAAAAAAPTNERLAIVQESQSSSSLLLVLNLKSNAREFARKHQDQIVWLELSHTSNSLVFRDSQKRLYLVFLGEGSPSNSGASNKAASTDPATMAATTAASSGYSSSNNHKTTQLLLEACEFAKWLPESDILVGQSSHRISIWYNIEELNNVLVLDSRAYSITNSAPILDLSFKRSQGDGLLASESGSGGGGVANNNNSKPYPWILSATSSHLGLSNGVCVPLDRAKVRFYTEIAGSRLEPALEALEREDSSKNLDGLWSSLGWIAIGRGECEIAVRAFRKLEHTSMVECLEKCLEYPDEREWRLAMLKGDWDAFERIAEHEQIIATYKRLNKWSRALDYLSRTQQFRQRDLVEQEFRQWLVDKGRFLEGARIQAKSGDLAGAIELLLANQRFEEATELFVGELKSPIQSQRTEHERRLADLAEQLKVGLIAAEQQQQQQQKGGGPLFDKAALVSERILGDREEALELYLAGNAYLPALKLAREIAPNRVANLEEAYGDFLMDGFRHETARGQTRKQTLAAVDHYLECSAKIKALSAAIELMDFQRAFEVLKRLGGSQMEANRTEIKEHSSAIAKFMLERGDRQKAIEALLAGEHYEQLIGLYIEQADFKRAFEISRKFKHANDKEATKQEFLALARRLAEAADSAAGSTNKAEEIYLLLEEPDLAIEAQRQAKNYERMLALVEQHRPDSLESCLLLLARELEQAGRFEEAERYLLRASDSEWTNVVRMYRLANKWEEAYRVARGHCLSEQDPLLVQLAYFWAKSLLSSGAQGSDSSAGSEAPLGAALRAQNLLKKLQVLNLVVNFCCENKNFQLALEFLHQNPESSGPQQQQQQQDASGIERLRGDVIKRYAAFLEEQRKFDKAEELLLRYDQVEAAAKMYADNDLHADAIRVVESRLAGAKEASVPAERRRQYEELLQKTLVSCADRLASEVKPTTSASLRQQQLLMNGSGKFAQQYTDKLLAAQQMYLRAQRPELAVELYKERGLWQEAIQVAQRFAPQLLESVEQALDSRVAGDLGPIVAAANAANAASAGAAAAASSMSRSQSRTNLTRTTGDSATIAPAGQQQQQPISGARELALRRQSQPAPLGQTIDYLRGQAELSMRQGDLRATKQALAKFLDSLIEGSFQNEASLEQANDWLGQLERILINCGSGGGAGQPEAVAGGTAANGLGGRGQVRADRALLTRILVLADRIGERCSWGCQLIGSEQQRQRCAGELVAWLRLRDILAACCATPTARPAPPETTNGASARQYDDDDEDDDYGDQYDEDDENDEEDDEDEVDKREKQSRARESSSLRDDLAADVEELERRLLVAHYVSLHGSLVGQLQANLQLANSTFAGSRAAARARDATGGGGGGSGGGAQHAQLSLARLGRLRAEQPASADILDLLAKLSLALLRYTDLLEAKLAFYNAGFWLLANNRRALARFAWSRLVELCDGLISASSSNLADQLALVGVPGEQRLVNSGSQSNGASSLAAAAANKHNGAPSASLSSVSQQQVQEVRNWLLETLIDASGGDDDASTRPSPSPSSTLSSPLGPLDERGEFESSLRPGRRARNVGGVAAARLPACLVSGYPVFANADQLILGPPAQANNRSSSSNGGGGAKLPERRQPPGQVASKYQVRLSEWRRLVLLSRRFGRPAGAHSTRPIGRAQQHQPAGESGGGGGSGGIQKWPPGCSGGAPTPLKDVVDFIVKLSGADTKVSQQIQ